MSKSGEIQPSRWIKAISQGGTIRGVAIQATGLIQSMAERHQLHGVGARGLGEAAMGALLVASYCKMGERVNLNIQGSGYYQQALVDAYPDGALRGYVIPRAMSPEHLRIAGDLGPWGSGVLSVLRTKGEEGSSPYIGTVPLLTGHLAKDLTFYWAQSEQIPSAVGLVVNLKNDRIISAGGFLVQAMPGASREEIAAIERGIHDLQSLAEHMSRDEDPLHLLSQIFQNTAFLLVEERPLEFRCNCSRERVERALRLVGVEELQSMLAEEKTISVRCDFCTTEYSVNSADLQRLLSGDGGPAKTKPQRVKRKT